MNKVSKMNRVPDHSIILNNFGTINYVDCFKSVVDTTENVDAITTKIFMVPAWVRFLLNLRNSVVQWFGLKTGKEGDVNTNDYYPIGSKAVVFDVIDRNENEIVMAENDKHLNFCTSVMLEHHGAKTTISLSTVVKFNNIWGRLYFLPVKPFHKIIIKSLLRKIPVRHS